MHLRGDERHDQRYSQADLRHHARPCRRLTAEQRERHIVEKNESEHEPIAPRQFIGKPHPYAATSMNHAFPTGGWDLHRLNMLLLFVHFPTRSLRPFAPKSNAMYVIVNQKRGQANDDLAPGNETDDPPLPRVVLHPA